MLSKRLVALFLFLIFFSDIQAQPNVDSLMKAIPAMKEDTNKVKALNTIAMLNRDENPKLAIEQGSEALTLADQLNWKEGMAMAHNVLGVCYRNTGKYPLALENMLQSLKINEELKDDGKAAKNLGNIGNIYRDLGNFPKAMEYLNRAYEGNKKVGNTIGMTNNLSDMGIVAAELKDVKGSMEYFDKALEIAEESGDKEGVAIVYGNIANVYSQQRNVDKAVEYFNRSLAINKELNRMPGIAVNTMNLAGLHYEIGVDSIKPTTFGEQIPTGKEANLQKSVDYFRQAIPIYEQVSHIEGLYNAYKGLSLSYTALGNYKAALDAMNKAISFNDSIRSSDNNVKLARLGEDRAELEKEQQSKLAKLTENKRRNETIFFSIGILLLGVAFVFVSKERRKSDKLLLNILPAEVATELKKTGGTAAKYFDEVTVLFTDFVNFTTVAERLSPQALVDELHTCFKAFDGIISKYKIEKIKTVGDAYLAVSGLPVRDPLHAEKVINAAIEITEFVRQRKTQMGENTFEIRVGINSGSVVAGIVGVKKFAYDIWGDTVNIAARMEQHSEAGKINISQTTYELVKGKFKVQYRGEIEVKGKGEMAMYFVG